MWRFRWRRPRRHEPPRVPADRRTGSSARELPTLVAEYTTGPGVSQFMVACEVREVANYAAVARVLREWGAAQLLGSVWLVETRRSALELRTAVCDAIGDDDAVAVVEIQQGAWWACENAEPNGLEWLREKVLS